MVKRSISANHILHHTFLKWVSKVWFVTWLQLGWFHRCWTRWTCVQMPPFEWSMSVDIRAAVQCVLCPSLFLFCELCCCFVPVWRGKSLYPFPRQQLATSQCPREPVWRHCEDKCKVQSTLAWQSCVSVDRCAEIWLNTSVVDALQLGPSQWIRRNLYFLVVHSRRDRLLAYRIEWNDAQLSLVRCTQISFRCDGNFLHCCIIRALFSVEWHV